MEYLVGSGKTTLLMSLLGETNKLAGQSFLPSPVVRSTGSDPSILTDTTAYCSQSPWLLSDTIQANILFGSPMNASRYKTVLDVCALEPDLKQFELGDATEVGEKGTVLSGGQKVCYIWHRPSWILSDLVTKQARISLARAIYSPAKHILADDVLSAVDSHTFVHLLRSLPSCFPSLTWPFTAHNISSKNVFAANSCDTERASWSRMCVHTLLRPTPGEIS